MSLHRLHGRHQHRCAAGGPRLRANECPDDGMPDHRRSMRHPAMTNRPPEPDLFRMLCELRDSLLYLSGCLREFQFENDNARKALAIQELENLLERLRNDDPPGT